MSIWNNNYCGSNYGPKIEISSIGDQRIERQTHYHGPFSSGTTLIWDNNGENRWGAKNLGRVSGFQVYPVAVPIRRPTDYFIFFKIIGGGGDDFCPKTLTIYCNDGTKYAKYDMKGWFDNRKGRGWWKAWKL